jgi:replicative DNA helicase
MEGQPLPETLAHLAEDVEGATGGDETGHTLVPVRLVDALNAFRRQLEDDAPPPRRARTGIARLDACLGGGILPGKLLILAARPAVGKSAMALQVATNAAQDGLAVLIISGEMLVEEQTGRLLSQMGRIDGLSLARRRLTGGEYGRLVAAYGKLHNLPVWMTDQARTLADVERLVRRWPYTPLLGLVIVDYLQLVHTTHAESRRLEVETVTRGLKGLCLKTGVPIMAISSLNRAPQGQEERPPVMRDLRETGDIEYAADLIVFLHRPETEPGGETQLRVAKNRGGRTGTTTLRFVPECVTFEQAPEGE